MRLTILFLCILISSLPFGLQAASLLDFEYGKNRFTIVVDGISREYYVHIPKSYKDNIAVPMVFMLHGTSGNGEVFYDVVGWKELSEKENFLAVFPSSMRYKIIDEKDGSKTTTKWNTVPDGNYVFQEGQKGEDDIKFLRKVIIDMQGRFKIDASRIYLDGFSNGGSMAAKCSIEMSDVLAAVAQNAGSFFIDTIYFPIRKLPVLYQVGNRDYGPGNTNAGPMVPMHLFDSLLRYDLKYLNGKHHRIAQNHIRNFGLDSTFVITGDSNLTLVATYQPKTPGPGIGYEFKYIFVKNLGHAYPNGVNHPLDSPKQHWEWMKNFKLENGSSSTIHQLNVDYGCGSGMYNVGDTVHIWAETPDDSKTFLSWSGDQQFTEEKSNWHTTFVMPDRDADITANFILLPSDLEYKKVMVQGPQSIKTVYCYFPPKEKIKCVAWLFQGSNSVGAGWIKNTEQHQLMDLLASQNYGVITMDAEEVTQQIDLNGTGVLEFDYRFDTINNLDLINVKYVRNHFISNGLLENTAPQIAIGFSSGGAYAQILAAIYNWRASLGHNTSGIDFLAEKSIVPHYQCNSQNDTGENVGTIGNISAYNDYLKYQNRNVCSHFILQKPQPLHAQRFARIDGVNLNQSLAMFNALKNANVLDVNNYLLVVPNLIEMDYKNHPEKYPLLQSFSSEVVDNIFDQLKVVYTQHIFRSDYNGTALNFINQLCQTNQGNQLIVENGYGGGIIPEGKKVHVWAEEEAGKVFSHWTGDTDYLESAVEYHTTLTMPERSVHIVANYSDILPYMEFDNIVLKAAQRNKRIYTYFPNKEKMKGVVWMFHGTNGDALSWVNDIEKRHISNSLMVADYGIIALTSEESEFNLDFDNDGNYRWSYGIDSNLIDMANIRAIRDEMIRRGKMDQKTPNIALGFSAGGAFTEFVAAVLDWRAAVNHNTSGNQLLAENSTIPYFLCISQNDNHPEVGPTGNAEAVKHYETYLDREVCVAFEEHYQMPLFAERFDRSPLISETLSKAIFDEIKVNNGMDNNNVLKAFYNQLEAIVVSNPAKFPVIVSLTNAQRSHIKEEIETTNAEHNFKADFNGRTIAFISQICGLSSAVQETEHSKNHLSVIPNPASNSIEIHATKEYNIYNMHGLRMYKGEATMLDISDFPKGIYVIKSQTSQTKFVKM